MDNDKIIEVNLLNKNYGKLQVLKDVSFSVKEKAFLLFLDQMAQANQQQLKY